jgi:hypothetical protein
MRSPPSLAPRSHTFPQPGATGSGAARGSDSPSASGAQSRLSPRLLSPPAAALSPPPPAHPASGSASSPHRANSHASPPSSPAPLHPGAAPVTPPEGGGASAEQPLAAVFPIPNLRVSAPAGRPLRAEQSPQTASAHWDHVWPAAPGATTPPPLLPPPSVTAAAAAAPAAHTSGTDDWLPVTMPPDGDAGGGHPGDVTGAAPPVSALDWGGSDASSTPPLAPTAPGATSKPAAETTSSGAGGGGGGGGGSAGGDRFHPATLSALQLLAEEYGDD